MPIPPHIEMIPVISSNVDEIGYDPTFRRLYVRFLSGWAYSYDNVPEYVFRQMQLAASKGRFVWRELRDYGRDWVYAYRRL